MSEKKIPFWVEFISGWIGGIGQVLTAQPFDIIKIRLQTQSLTNPIYTGASDALKKIIKNEGIHTFYKGTASPILGVGTICAFQFMAYQECKKWLENIGIGSTSGLAFFISGAFSGISSAFLVAPVEHLRIRMQIEGLRPVQRYTGALDAGVKIFKKYGLRGVQKGWIATKVRDAGFYAVYFYVYEKLFAIFKGDNEPSPFHGFFAGGLTGIASWLCVFPTDSLKSIAQTDAICPTKRKYHSYTHMVKTVLKEQGIKKLYHGLDVCLLRAFPVNAVTFVVYEAVRNGIYDLAYGKKDDGIEI